MTLLCLAPHCRVPGRHSTDCLAEPDKPCRGCLPALAADGLYLCGHCLRGLERDAVEAAALHGDLALALTGRGGVSEIRVHAAHPGLAIADPVVEHRTAIRHTLVSWVLLIAEERGTDLPTAWRVDPIPLAVLVALGRRIAINAGWLAQQRLGAEAAGELRDLVSTGRTLRQPSGTSIVPIGPCPRDGEGGRCEGTLKALVRKEASLLPSMVVCDVDETHSWDSTQWTKLGRVMAGRV